MRLASAAPPDCSKPGCVLADDVLALIMTAVAGGYIQERETTTIEIALVGDASIDVNSPTTWSPCSLEHPTAGAETP